MWGMRWWSVQEYREISASWLGIRYRLGLAEKLRSMPGRRANWPLPVGLTLSATRPSISRPRSPTRSRFICFRCISTWTTTICASGTIRCWLLRHWLRGCARWPSCFLRTQGSSSPFSTSGDRICPRFRRSTQSNLLLCCNQEVNGARLVRADCDRLLPGPGFGEKRPLDSVFGKDVMGVLFSGDSPAFVPGHNLVSSRGHIGKFEVSAFVGHGIVGMRDNHHLGAHPYMAAIATKMNQAGVAHDSRTHLILEREWQVEAGRALHVDGVQRSVRTLHAQGGILRNEQNVGDIVATPLVEMAPLFRQVNRLAAGNVLEVDHGVGYTALRSDDQAV